MIHSSNKITVIKWQQNNFIAGGCHDMRNCIKGWQTLGRLRTTAIGNDWKFKVYHTSQCLSFSLQFTTVGSKMNYVITYIKLSLMITMLSIYLVTKLAIGIFHLENGLFRSLATVWFHLGFVVVDDLEELFLNLGYLQHIPNIVCVCVCVCMWWVDNIFDMSCKHAPICELLSLSCFLAGLLLQHSF